jgi:pimeloyl-ACP methyl ester carboxylesterase
VSGRDHLLRASTYHRTAEYYGGSSAGGAGEAGARSQACFSDAAALLDPPVERLEVPFEGGSLPGYLVRPVQADDGPRPTLVCVGGFDSSAEELYFQLGAPGAERGWNVFVFDGPGQPGAMRRDPALTFRPDYEVPIGAVLDHLAARPEVDADRLALAGQSFGSYFAARSAATDRRVRALVADPPVVDMSRYMEAWVGSEVFRMKRDMRPEDVIGVPEDLMPRQMQWGIAAICERFGVPSFHAWRDAIGAYRLGGLVGDIRCPVLALVGDREGAEPLAQFDALVAEVDGPVDAVRFIAEDGASTHCQSDNIRLSAQVIFDWLDERLAH